MVITGAGPGIMEAGIEGAGAANSFGVEHPPAVRGGHDRSSSPTIPKLVNFRYFFTRKVTFVKESHAFVLLPGGFGTLDEAFELLTLVQTGKATAGADRAARRARRHVLVPWLQFVASELRDRGYISPHDLDLVKITDDVDVALEEIRPSTATTTRSGSSTATSCCACRRCPTTTTLVALNEEFADIVVRGEIEPAEASKAEVADDDVPDLARLRFRFDRRGYARLRALIDRLNG